MIDTLPVTIGGLLLTGAEVPTFFDRGGHIRTSSQHVIGGGRILQLLGMEPQRRQFEGCFLGPLAAERGQVLEAMRDAMNPIILTIGAWTELVVITGLTIRYLSQGHVVRYLLCAEPIAEPSSTAIQTEAAILAGLSTDLGSCASAIASATSALPVVPLRAQLSSLSAAAATATDAQTLEGLDIATSATVITTAMGVATSSMTSITQRSGPTDLVAGSNDLATATTDTATIAVATRAGAYLNRSASAISKLAGAAPSPIIHS